MRNEIGKKLFIFRQRKFGYNPAREFTEQMNRHFEQNMGQG